MDSYAGKLTGKDFGNVIRCIRFDLPLSLPPAVAIIVGISTVLGGATSGNLTHGNRSIANGSV